jgi:hypothetical protein
VRWLVLLGLCLALSAQAQTVSVNPGALPALSGDCSNSGNALTCTKTNGSSFAPSATTDATNAGNISAGVLGSARGGAGSISGALKANGSGTVSGAACGDLSNAAASCSTDATNAANIASGTMANARLPTGVSGILASLRGANFNSTADQAIALPARVTTYQLTSIIVTNCSASLTLGAGGFYTGASKTGTILVLAAQAYSALTSSTVIFSPTLTAAAAAKLTAGTIFLSLTSGLGSAATCDVFLAGQDLT